MAAVAAVAAVVTVVAVVAVTVFPSLADALAHESTELNCCCCC